MIRHHDERLGRGFVTGVLSPFDGEVDRRVTNKLDDHQRRRSSQTSPSSRPSALSSTVGALIRAVSMRPFRVWSSVMSLDPPYSRPAEATIAAVPAQPWTVTTTRRVCLARRCSKR